jgi:hypothetical protein
MRHDFLIAGLLVFLPITARSPADDHLRYTLTLPELLPPDVTCTVQGGDAPDKCTEVLASLFGSNHTWAGEGTRSEPTAMAADPARRMDFTGWPGSGPRCGRRRH